MKKISFLKGFTLVEMLVSISIIAVITSIFWANYRSAYRNTELLIVTKKTAGDTRLAQNYSLAARKFNASQTYGWGFHLSTSSKDYILFSDQNQNGLYDPPGELSKTYKLSSNFGVKQILVGGGMSVSAVDIVFVPPDPRTIITYGASTSTTATITLQDINNNTNNIFINLFGLIDVN